MDKRRWTALLGVIPSARQVLADLEHDEIPTGLARVAAQTGRRLPPPFARRLLDELDSNEWLREQVAARFDGSTDASDPLEVAAALFLYRPEGWESRLEEITRSSEDSERADRMDQMAHRIEALETELEGWRNRARRLRREAEEAAARSDRRAAARAEAEIERRRRDMEDLGRENRRLTRRLATVTAERDEIADRLARTRRELARERRIERSPAPATAPSAWADLDVLGAARLLDDVAAALSPATSFAVEARKADQLPLCLPHGTAPDDRRAIEWLLDLERSFCLLVDGYNVAFHVDRDRFTRPEIRRRLENDLVRFRSLARANPRVILVYDSSQSGGTTADSASVGVEVRFTSAGHAADDELVDLAATLGGSAVIVTSDRRVRESAQRLGSMGLWSESLAAWMLNG